MEKLSQRELSPLPDLRLLDSLGLGNPPMVEVVVQDLCFMIGETCESQHFVLDSKGERS